MPQFRAPRGTRDLLPDEAARFARFAEVAGSLTERYGYRPIETPVFEQAAVFERGIGQVTDVVEKELFRIAPRTEESEAWALRPETTAGIVRAYVQHGMRTWPQPVRLTSTGPIFRYDRPQAGRYRQFWQFDVEAIGAFYRGHAGELPPTERDRLERNPLRLLDSKDPAMAALNAVAPRAVD